MNLAPSSVGSRAFFSAHPVFRREEYAAAVGRQRGDKVLTAMLSQHLKAGNIKRVSRGVYAAVPAHAAPETWVADRFLAASKLRRSAVIAYHSALELHGVAYSVAPDVQAISTQEPALLETPDFACRFVARPKGFVAKRDIVQVDRVGLIVPTTSLERTIADVFDRPDLAGGAEELVNCLALVARLNPETLLRQIRGLKNAGAAGALGWWLEGNRERLGIPDKTLVALHRLQPKHPQYVLSARKGAAKFISAWNILVPESAAASSFEGA